MLKPGFGVGNDGVGRQGVHQLVTRTKHAVINCKCFFWFTLFEARVAGAQPVARSYLGGPMIALDLGLALDGRWSVVVWSPLRNLYLRYRTGSAQRTDSNTHDSRRALLNESNPIRVWK